VAETAPRPRTASWSPCPAPARRRSSGLSL
jgi:hypothetical protein